jgi:hypothetical protein
VQAVAVTMAYCIVDVTIACVCHRDPFEIRFSSALLLQLVHCRLPIVVNKGVLAYLKHLLRGSH